MRSCCRSLVAAATAFGLPAIIVRPTRAADFSFKQFHNQAAGGTLQKNLTAMWDAIKADTNGRVEKFQKKYNWDKRKKASETTEQAASK